jgi:hypothetical protein
MYKLLKSYLDENICMVLKTDINLYIPFDPDNMDFVEYNKWLSEGNIPLPPDEPTLP